MMGRLLVRIATITLLFVVLAAEPAGAAQESIRAYDVTMEIRADGSIDVTEEITYDFGAEERHGPTRSIPTREPVVAEKYGRGKVRAYEITGLEVSSPSGAPADVEESDSDASKDLRIGDPDRTVRGVQRYRIRYHLTGALNAQSTWDELYWDAIPGDSYVPTRAAEVRVTAPGGIERVTCFSGGIGSKDRCANGEVVSPREARFEQRDLSSRQALTVVVALKQNSVAVPPPVVVDENNILGGAVGELAARAGPATYALGGLLLLGCAALAGLFYWRGGRDQQYTGLPSGLAPVPGASAVIGTGRRGEIPVEFRPPQGVGPGLAGTLIDESADTDDVSAMIVDLAVRRFVRIEEIPADAFWKSRDWKLVRLDPPPDDELTPIERQLVSALFGSKGEVRLNDLKQRFAPQLTSIKNALYDESVSRGWFSKRPDKVRKGWKSLGLTLVVCFALGLIYAWNESQYGLMAVTAGGVLGGNVLWWASRFMPARTADGTAMTVRVQGFRRYLATAEADQIRFEEGVDIFSRYLPYAMVFGVAERWGRVFADLATTRGFADVSAGGMYWYSGSSGFDFHHLSMSMSGFASTAGSTMSASASSSSSGGSGFSGGGSSGGGGGGGSVGSW